MKKGELGIELSVYDIIYTDNDIDKKEKEIIPIVLSLNYYSNEFSEKIRPWTQLFIGECAFGFGIGVDYNVCKYLKTQLTFKFDFASIGGIIPPIYSCFAIRYIFNE